MDERCNVPPLKRSGGRTSDSRLSENYAAKQFILYLCKGIMRRWLIYFTLGVSLSLRASEPCAHCQEDPFCLGSCGYELLLRAETPGERFKAQVILSKAWVLGDFHEGAVNILSEALRDIPSEDPALVTEAYYWLAQAYRRLSPDSAEYYYKLIREIPGAPPYWKAKANMALSSLLREKNPTRAQAYAFEALEAARQTQDNEIQALSLNQLAVLAADARQYDKAQHYAEEALQLARSLSKPRLLAAVLTNLASIYEDIGKSQSALSLYQEALSMAPDTLSQAHALLNLANYYYNQKQTTEAEKILNRIVPALPKLPFMLRKSYYQLRFYIALDRRAPQEAARFFEAMLSEASKAIQEVEASRTAQLEQLSGLRQRESQLRQMELSRSRERIFYGLMGGLALIGLGGAGYAYRTARRRAREEAAFRQEIETLNQTLVAQSQQLERQNQELLRISEALSEAIQDLQDSISAAERLQKALMPPLRAIFPGTTVYYQPLQQVGGDFYIVAGDPLNGRYLIAVGDGTGHGVGGSILASIFGATIQNFFLQNSRQSARALLMRVHNFAIRLLASQDSAGNPIREGCDVAMVIFDVRQEKVEVGMAGRPVWIWNPQAGLQELDGGRRGLDSFTPLDYDFPAYEIPLSPHDIFYLFTDGVTDVLNPQGRKWGIKRLRELILKLDQEAFPVAEQESKILKAIEEWRGHTNPNDDATLLLIPVESILVKARDRT